MNPNSWRPALTSIFFLLSKVFFFLSIMEFHHSVLDLNFELERKRRRNATPCLLPKNPGTAKRRGLRVASPPCQDETLRFFPTARMARFSHTISHGGASVCSVLYYICIWDIEFLCNCCAQLQSVGMLYDLRMHCKQIKVMRGPFYTS